MPFDRTVVVHRDWAGRHRPVAAGAMTAVCTIRKPGPPGAWTPSTGAVAGDSGTVLAEDVACRVQVAPATDRAADAAGQQVSTREYVVELQHDLPEVPAGEHGAILTVTECVDDPLLVDRPLRVISVVFGSLRWSRVLRCTDDLTNQAGGYVMADGVIIDGSGFHALEAAFNGAARRADRDIHNLLRKTGAATVADARAFAPVDTGNLRNSIGWDYHRDGDVSEVEVGPTAEYAMYVEFGTSQHAPAAFMGPAMDRQTPTFVAACEALAAKALLDG